MPRREFSAFALLCVNLVRVHAAEPVQEQFNGLIKNSPFGQQGLATGALNGNEANALEFRGVFAEKGEYFFSIYETATRSSQWVSLKESSQPFIVESYDESKGAIQVKYRNQVTTLTLKRAQIIVQVPPPVALPPSAAGTGITPNTTPTDEANRLALVAEEIRRRRALRTQGPGPQPYPGGPQPTPGSGPRPTMPIPAKP
jgi:hypothetical protein